MVFEIVAHENGADFLRLSGPYLERRESEHNLALGLAHNLAKDPAAYGEEQPYLLSVLAGDTPVGAAIMTPPRRVNLSRIAGDVGGAVAALIAHLQRVDLPGVNGPVAEARAFCSAWAGARPGVEVILEMELRVFEARQVEDVPLAAGGLRVAVAEELELVATWFGAFSRDIGEPADAASERARAQKGIEAGEVFVWDDGGPVAMAKTARPIRHGITVTGVYTPPENRGRGYATSCVHQLTAGLLDGDWDFCSLYTDLANPTSNNIYQKIGYRPLGDALSFDFTY